MVEGQLTVPLFHLMEILSNDICWFEDKDLYDTRW